MKWIADLLKEFVAVFLGAFLAIGLQRYEAHKEHREDARIAVEVLLADCKETLAGLAQDEEDGLPPIAFPQMGVDGISASQVVMSNVGAERMSDFYRALRNLARSGATNGSIPPFAMMPPGPASARRPPDYSTYRELLGKVCDWAKETKGSLGG